MTQTQIQTHSNSQPPQQTTQAPQDLQPTQSLDSFAPRLLDWFAQHGRHDLPWQQHQTSQPDPYPVWLSEVMLQQTQVTTVIPYFQRFMQSFPDVHALAAASWDDVAEHWAGLGYYARARNLHKGAKQLHDIIQHTGDFPQSVAEWESITGVGRSTAGAIVAMGLHGYGVICDGNVKRVLTRWAAIEGDITKAATGHTLWALAERLTPEKNSGHFAQAMMDLGATLCTRSKPACLLCPLQADCLALANNSQSRYPIKAKKKPKPSKYSHALLLKNPQQQILWLQRPDSGIWGGLWSLPLQFQQKTTSTPNKTNAKSNAQTDSVYEAEYTLAEQIIQQYLEQHHIKYHQVEDQSVENQSIGDQNNGQSPQHNVQIKHTLTHFHWYLSLHSAALTADQSNNLTDQLSAAHIHSQWLTLDQVKSSKSSLALPKAMLKLLSHID